MPAASPRLGRLLFVNTVGALLLALAAPLGNEFRTIIGLSLLLLLSAGLLRLNGEINSLRSQLRASEAMGWAGVHDPDGVDGSLLMKRFLALAQELVPAERSLVWILDQDTGELAPEFALPDKGPFDRKCYTFGEGLIGHAAARMTPRVIPDAARASHRLPREDASGAWLLYPIVVHDQLLGVAQWIRSSRRPFSHKDILRLDALVPQTAIALENIYIRARMQDAAATDGLTGLWNHRRLYELLREEIRRAVRYQRALAVLMMDVDSFKTFNDTYGHPQGDQLLRVVASVLKSCVRNVDYAGRYGGEEFLIILPETSKEDACSMAERIRSEIEARACVLIEGQPIHRTISIGVAATPEDASSVDELMQRADEALYRAKRSGKNRVVPA
jgi:diguanylate cyclase (GGDEF)-like protein